MATYKTASHYCFERQGPKEPTTPPAKYFPAYWPPGGPAMRNLRAEDLYDACWRDMWITFSRQELFSLLGGTLFTQEGVLARYPGSPPPSHLKRLEWWYSWVRDTARPNAYQNKPWPLKETLEQLKQMQERALVWLFEETHLAVFYWAKERQGDAVVGTWKPASFWLIERGLDDQGAAKPAALAEATESARRVDGAKKKDGRGRKPLTLDSEKRDLGRRARRYHNDGRRWDDIETLCGGFTAKTLRGWIRILEDEERAEQTVIN